MRYKELKRETLSATCGKFGKCLMVAISALAAAGLLGWGVSAGTMLLTVTAAAALAAFVLAWIRAEGTVKALRAEVLGREGDLFEQIQSLFSIYSQIQFRQTLPPMGGWAVSPDFAAQMITEVSDRRPQLVLEASSGVSTVLIAYCLERQKASGRVIALEHDASYAERSRAEIARHGLQQYAEVVYAPLKPYVVAGREFLWYDLSRAEHLSQAIDMLVVDGPPGGLQHLSRYPALPLLYSRLSSTAVVLVDDADRPDEVEMVRRWGAEFPDVKSRHLSHSKGTEVLCRGAAFVPCATANAMPQPTTVS